MTSFHRFSDNLLPILVARLAVLASSVGSPAGFTTLVANTPTESGGGLGSPTIEDDAVWVMRTIEYLIGPER